MFSQIQKEKGVCYLLITVTLIVFLPVLQNGFVALDDQVYVAENPCVQMGITIKSITWALVTTYAGFWHPLTWLSLIVDAQLYGLNPAGFHLTNLLLHIANSLLVFFVFRRMTGALWRSAFVAALFALHPLHVESVAWVAERKDVLSTLFWMLTIWFYIRYVENPCTKRYFLVIVFFILGLMAKSMLVTLPFVLLLLDYWPLNRLQTFQKINDANIKTYPDSNNIKNEIVGAKKISIKLLIVEKLPLLFFSVIASGITVFAQGQFGALDTMEYASFPVRIGNALISYIKYLFKTFWPENLVIFYPLNLSLSVWEVVLTVLVLVSITILFMYTIKRKPYCAVGWFWYIGTLVPVIGVIPVGVFSMADRYTYVPLIGIFVIIAWGVPDMLSQYSYRKPLLTLMALSVLICLSLATRVQISYWRNSFALYTHALDATKDNIAVHYFMGNLYFKQGIFEQAADQFRKALQIYPDFIDGRQRLGMTLSSLGRQDEAMEIFNKILKSNPYDIDARVALATAFIRKGNHDEGIKQYRCVIRINPNDATGYYNLAHALTLKGNIDDAVTTYQRAIQLKPDYTEAYNNLGVLLLKLHRAREAIFYFQKVLETNPEHAGAFYNIGVALLEEGSIREAIKRFKKALEIQPEFASAHYRLGQAFLKEENVQFAVYHFREALRINPDYKDAQSSLENTLKKQ
jgi:tetratricopeptide (TPR) repeat protein